MIKMNLWRCRLQGRLFYFLFSAFLCACVARASTGPTLTTVSDVIYHADGSPATGTLVISWDAFTTADGSAVPAGQMSVSTSATGAIEVGLAPNEGATPQGSYYTVVYKLDDGTTSTEYWTVPATSPTTIAAIRAAVVPKQVALALQGNPNALVKNPTSTQIIAGPYDLVLGGGLKPAVAGQSLGAPGSEWSATLASLTSKGITDSGTIAGTAINARDAFNGCKVVGNSYKTVQEAVDAAGASGCVIVPTTYTGTDTYENVSGIPVLDFRDVSGAGGLMVGGNGFYINNLLRAGPSLDASGRLIPLGNDLALHARGAADMINSADVLSVSSTTSVTAGSHQIMVGDTSKFYPGSAIVIDRFTANEETIASGDWTINDGTHITATFAKPHDLPYTVDQWGAVDSYGWLWRYLDQETGSTLFRFEEERSGASRGFAWQDPAGAYLYRWDPTNNSPALFGGNGGGAGLTFYGSNGITGTTGNFAWKNNLTDGTNILFLNNDGTLTMTGPLVTSSIIASGTSQLTINTAAAAGFDFVVQHNGSNQLVISQVNGNTLTGNFRTTGFTTADGGLVAGGGTLITKHISGTASLDYSSWTGGSCQDKTITLNGAADGDTVTVGVPAALASVAGLQFSGFVSAANTVTVRGCKITSGASADPPAATVRADVWQH